MLFVLLRDATVVVHLAFIVYVVIGGFVAWKYPRTIWLHAVAAAWGFASIVVGIDCPLTDLENWARARGGDMPLPPEGFIAHYLTGVIYPESALGLVRLAAVASVSVSWVGYATIRVRRRQRVQVPQ